MSTNLSFREPKASGDVGSSTLKISGSQVSMAVNELPSVALAVHAAGVKSGDLVDLSSPKITKWLAKNQKNKFTELPTVNLYQDSGNKNYLTTSGLLTVIAYEATKSSCDCRLALCANAAHLQPLRTDIYRQDADENKDPAEIIEAKNMASMFSQVLEKIIEVWVKQKDARGTLLSAMDQKILDQIHAVNETTRTYWQRLFKDSEATTKLEFLPDITRDINQAMQDSIQRVFLTQTGDFFQQLVTLCDMFNLLYIPDVGGTDAPYGRLISKDAIMGITSPAVASMAHVTSGLGAHDVVPLAAVVVIGTGTEGAKEGGTDKGLPVTPVYATWPDPLPEKARGRFVQLPLPAWLPAIYGPLNIDEDIAEANSQALDAKQHMSGTHKDRKDSMDDQKDAQRSILSWWARMAYLDMALQQDTLSMDVPLDYNWQLGYRYAVTDRNSNRMFTGFLARIGHSLMVGEDGGEAATSLVFTHVECEGFTLPHKGPEFKGLPLARVIKSE